MHKGVLLKFGVGVWSIGVYLEFASVTCHLKKKVERLETNNDSYSIHLIWKQKATYFGMEWSHSQNEHKNISLHFYYHIV